MYYHRAFYHGILLSATLDYRTVHPHAFHVHAHHMKGHSPDGDYVPTCAAAGGHFFYGDAIHGQFTDAPPDRHEGQLGNIHMDGSQFAQVDIYDKILNIIPGKNVDSAIL